MSNPTTEQIVALLACPDCGGDVRESGEGLACVACPRTYEIRGGIPLLYPSSIDVDHLQEEESLAAMMSRQPTSKKDAFNLEQWALSKEEFWGMVRSQVKPPPATIVNIGCGYDSHFEEFEKQGYRFVNFDVVYEMLHSLQERHAASSCVAGDVNALPFKRHVFDYVVSIDVIHHESERLGAILGSFSDLLKPGGTLFLEDPNAWGMFQLAKSVMLPKPVYRFLRATYHGLKRSTHRPADYEFPTSVWGVKAMLQRLGFDHIEAYGNAAYPCIGEVGYHLYAALRGIAFVRKYHNYHYMLSATRR